jgi:thiamine biosynthesis lipoprotein
MDGVRRNGPTSRMNIPMPITRRALFALDFSPRAATGSRWLRVHRTAMACRFEVTLEERDTASVEAAGRALDEADRIESLLTVFRETSELSRINREAAEGPVAADPEVFGLLQVCATLHAATGGAFDPTSTPLSRCWGFLRREGRVPSAAEIKAALALVGMDRVALDAATASIRFPAQGMALNLGAIGKGYAVDRMGRLLRRRGVARALVSAGGSSVVALGGRGRGWPIDVRSPQVSRPRIARVHLRHGALGTSGTGEQFVIADGARYGHVLDPRTGWPSRGVLSATVVTGDAAAADALSTAFLIGGPDLAKLYCDTHPNTWAMLLLENGAERPLVFGRHAGVTIET